MKKKILVAEDDPDILELVSEVLEDAGFEVFTSVGDATIEAVRRHQPDLLLLDYQMPGMDGITIAQHVHADPATNSIPIVAMTAAGKAPVICHEMDASGCLGKPFDIDQLVTVVNELFHNTHETPPHHD